MKKTKILCIILLVIFIELPNSFGQALSLQYPVINDYYRRQQLLGNENIKLSFNIRPIFPVDGIIGESLIAEDTSQNISLPTSLDINYENPPKFKLKILPVQMYNQHNSLYAFGGNDGAMVPNRGFQTVFSGGLFLNYKSLSLQIQPEVLWAQNQNYIGFPLEHQASILYYYEYLNRIDLPERFGEGVYTSILPGQSSLRLNFNKISMGISTENLWWGPSRRNSLLMSNNAPGFLHLTFNTIKPIHTVIGDFETQLIAGRLKNSNFLPPHSTYSIQNNPVFIPKRESNRYISGIIMSYQPKWVEGLFIGYSSINHMYMEDLGSIYDLLPIFNGNKGMNHVVNLTRDSRQQLSSGFFRWMNTSGHFEFYGEYGTNGNSRTMKDFLNIPEKNRAFTLGFSSLVPLKRDQQFIQISSEMTQTGQTIRESIRNLDTWYIHNHVRQGYTHLGQVLGVGYGPGANVNWIEVAWVKDFMKIGFEFERIAYNNDYYYFRYEASKDLRNKYVDLVPALVGDFRFGDFLLSTSIKHVNTLNYKWYLENDPDKYVVPGFDRKNLQINIRMAYLLK